MLTHQLALVRFSNTEVGLYYKEDPLGVFTDGYQVVVAFLDPEMIAELTEHRSLQDAFKHWTAEVGIAVTCQYEEVVC